jgi:hypothetical protein
VKTSTRLRALSFRVEDLIRKTEGTMYVNNELTTLKTDLRVKVNKEKAGMLGVPVHEIDRTVRMAIAGLKSANSEKRMATNTISTLHCRAKRDRPSMRLEKYM